MNKSNGTDGPLCTDATVEPEITDILAITRCQLFEVR